MTLYKFKSLTDFEFVADIIINNRLFSTEFTNLNDPMEGVFYYENGVNESIIEKLKNAKQKHKVCALTKDYQNPILWAHYADSFKGVCIEVEIDEWTVAPLAVDYIANTPMIRNGSYSYLDDSTIDALAISALTRKFEDWKYEEEVRLLHTDQLTPFIRDGVTVKSIIFGVHTKQIYKDIIQKIIPSNIELYDTELDKLSKVSKVHYLGEKDN